MKMYLFLSAVCYLLYGECRDEEKIQRACYWSNEVYDPCFGGCAEVSCDNPRNHLRPCYPYCEPGCVCEEPFVRDDRTHQCVLPQDCSPTQMGIPVPNKSVAKLYMPKYSNAITRRYKHEDIAEFNENDHPASGRFEDTRRDQGVGRMGNYFNIVIAPPPIKPLLPRKMIQNDAIRISTKQI